MANIFVNGRISSSGGYLYKDGQITDAGYIGDISTSISIQQDRLSLSYSKTFDDQAHADAEKYFTVSLADSGVQVNGNIVASTINNYGSSFISCSDGTKICWGTISCGANASVTVNFPIYYGSAPCVLVNSTSQGSSRDNNASCLSRTTTSATLRQCASSSTLFWVAIGK